MINKIQQKKPKNKTKKLTETQPIKTENSKIKHSGTNKTKHSNRTYQKTTKLNGTEEAKQNMPTKTQEIKPRKQQNKT